MTSRRRPRRMDQINRGTRILKFQKNVHTQQVVTVNMNASNPGAGLNLQFLLNQFVTGSSAFYAQYKIAGVRIAIKPNFTGNNTNPTGTNGLTFTTTLPVCYARYNPDYITTGGTSFSSILESNNYKSWSGDRSKTFYFKPVHHMAGAVSTSTVTAPSIMDNTRSGWINTTNDNAVHSGFDLWFKPPDNTTGVAATQVYTYSIDIRAYILFKTAV